MRKLQKLVCSTGEKEVWKAAQMPFEAAASLKRNPFPPALGMCIPGGGRGTKRKQGQRDLRVRTLILEKQRAAKRS